MAAKKKGTAIKAKKTLDPQPIETPATVSENVASFPIVGIGASAGGLAAFEAFFSGMPAKTDPSMAFVLVQHLAPDHKSILGELIGRYTRMQVFEVTDGMVVKPNCAYIIPPNHDMAFLNGALQLMEPAKPRGQRLPIDFFFRSLAQDQHERAICIVLSGTGSDGTLGLRAIKGEGGMAMAQNPESTEYDGMPRSAIATGLVDYELSPAEMPAQLMTYALHAFSRSSHRGTMMPPKAVNALKKVFILLRAQTGHDFSQYKPNTINRRIERRMAVNHIETIDSYVKYLQQTSSEVELLFRDLLIGVTNFFRDPETFKALEQQVIPKMLDNKQSGAAIRVWSPGCSTGEEAYSLAILLAERQEAMKKTWPVQIFATDIDSQAIATARAGVYPASIAADISTERLSRYFTAEPDGATFCINKVIRDMLVFSEQDMIKDPPFSNLDLISCRNLLIYMGGELQKKIIPLFHYALGMKGFLFLGTSETVGEFDELFSTVDRKAKIYQRKENYIGTPSRALGRFLLPMTVADAVLSRTANNTPGAVVPPMREITERALLQQVAPAGALVNGQGDILYLHGRTGLFLELAPGVPGTNILKMAREGLRRELATALYKAARTKEIVRYPRLRVKTNGDFSTVNLTVREIAQGSDAPLETPLYLVVLEMAMPFELEQSQLATSKSFGGAVGSEADPNARIAALKRELQTKEEYLQTSNEELETSNEELKSSNEEMQSVNEELQSTNEELETSKEELQSLNEELGTVNSELQTKVGALSQANNDMNNLLAGTGIGTIFVDCQLRILRFTPTASEIINLIHSDIGRPVSHIVSNMVVYNSLVADAQLVLDTLVPKEVEVEITAGDWFMMRIQPYRTLDNVIEGVVITFVNVTARRRAEEALQASEARFRGLFDSMTDMIEIIEIIYDENEQPIDWYLRQINHSFAKYLGKTREELVGKKMTSVIPAIEDSWLRAFASVEKTGTEVSFTNFSVESDRYFNIVAWKVTQNTIGVSFTDVTYRARSKDTLRKANEQFRRLAVVVNDAHDAITVQDLVGRIIAWNSGAVRMYGWSESEALKMNVHERIPAKLQADALDRILKLSREEILEPYRTQQLTKDGSVVEVSIISTALVDDTGKMYAIATTERAQWTSEGE
ncbi:MAG: two-component system CheB/CheR fusion protein [Candidatus Krumholzibacteriia bacterium]|jgi:two-component system CheB/CheR fusion protein